MRVTLVMLALALLLLESGGKATPAYNNVWSAPVIKSTMPGAHVDFEAQVKPMLQSKCMPCHFSGGQMYERFAV